MYAARLFVAALVFLAIIMGVSIGMLVPALFWSFVKEKAAQERLAVVSQIVSAEERKNLQENITAVNKKIDILGVETREDALLSRAIENAIARKNQDVSLVSFFYENRSADAREKIITVSGISKNRQSLLDFIHSLEEENAFSDVSVPVSNFVRSTAIPFLISLTLNNNGNTE